MGFNLRIQVPRRVYHIGVYVGVLSVILLAWRLIGGAPDMVGRLALCTLFVSFTCFGTYLLYRSAFLVLEKVSTWILGAVVGISTMGIWLGIPIIFAQMTPLVSICMIVGAYVTLLLAVWYAVRTHEAPQIIERASTTPWLARDVFERTYLWVVLYIGVWATGMFSLIGRASTMSLTSPWQALPHLYTGTVAVAGVVLVGFFFSRFKTAIILCMIVLQSILMHAGLPASHQLPVGGDIWRHLGIVDYIGEGQPVNPVLFGPTATFDMVGPLVLPTVLLQPQQFAYGFVWGMLTLVEYTTPSLLHMVVRWGMPLLWAVAVPMLFFYLGMILFRSQRHALVISAATLLPFAFLSLGSMLLPVTIGYLCFFWALLLLLTALRYGTRVQWGLVGMSFLGLIFVYPLHAILFAVLTLCAVILHRFRSVPHQRIRQRILLGMVILALPLLSLLELISGQSTWSTSPDIVASGIQFVGEHSGWYIASDIRPHDILSGNILWNHVPSGAFTSTLFSTFRWHLMIISLGVYVCALGGWIRVLYKEQRTVWQVLAVLFALVWGSYIISWYLLEGDRQLVRRLDIAAATVLILFGWYGCTSGLQAVLGAYRHRTYSTWVLIPLMLVLWWGSMSAFALGPDTRFVSTDEYQIGAYVAEQDPVPTCIVADTWPLLTVEAATARTTIGGGFAMDAQYGQPERVRLYELALTAPSNTLWSEIAQVRPDADRCYLVLPLTDPGRVRSYIDTYGNPTLVGTFGVWQHPLPK